MSDTLCESVRRGWEWTWDLRYVDPPAQQPFRRYALRSNISKQHRGKSDAPIRLPVEYDGVVP